MVTRARAPRAARRAVCQRCSAPVFRVLLIDGDRAGRVWMSAVPDKYGAGRVAAYRDVAGTWHARVLEHGQAPRPHERRHRPHVDECRVQRIG